MQSGRKPDPAALQAAKGNPGKRKRVTPEQVDAPAPRAGSVRPPAALTQTARQLWDQTAPELERMNFLRQTDAQAFARYCDALARFWDVRKKLSRVGATYWTDSAHGKMQRINPLFIVEERLAKRLTDLEDRFGLTPAARQQIMLRLAQGQGTLPFGGPAQPGADAGASAPPPQPESPIGLLGGGKLH